MNETVKFGISNCHYAIKTNNTWGTPVPLPNAVSISLKRNSSMIKKAADNSTVYSRVLTGDSEGTIVITAIPESMAIEVFGHVKDVTSKITTEFIGVKVEQVALGYQIETDTNPIRMWFYDVSLGAPDFEAATMEDGQITFADDTMALLIKGVPTTLGADKLMYRRYLKDPTSPEWDTFFDNVQYL